MPLQLVFFDLGDVVCRFVPERRLAAFVSETQLRADDIQQRLWNSGFSDDCDAGAYSSSDMRAQICQRLGVSWSQQDLHRLWSLAFEPNAEVLAIAAAVRRHLPTGLLTNNPPLLQEALAEFLPAIEHGFAPILFSYQHRSCKPSRALYEAVRHHLGHAANELLLIDDSLANVQGAEAAGWQAIQFENPDGLRKALRDVGISV
jgi:glucose-1-phosphatase